MSRADRLNFRFKTIQATLTDLYGRERAFAAATAAWLMAVQYMHKQALIAVFNHFVGGNGPVKSEKIEALEKEMETILQSFHAELCEHLGIDQEDAWALARAFKEVINDVCHQGG